MKNPDRHYVRIKASTMIFKLTSYAPVNRIEGYDEKDRLRCVFNIGRSEVIIQGPRGGNKQRYRMRDFVKPENLLQHAYLVTLKWWAPGGWSGSPLELLALCAE